MTTEHQTLEQIVAKLRDLNGNSVNKIASVYADEIQQYIDAQPERCHVAEMDGGGRKCKDATRGCWCGKYQPSRKPALAAELPEPRANRESQ